TMVPGASGAPTCGVNTCRVPFGVSTGATLGTTAPAICAVASGKPVALAFAVTVTCAPAWRGVQVPEYRAATGSARVRMSGGSPFENVVTIWPAGIALPQSSASLISSGVGQEAGAAKLLTRPVCVGTSCLGTQPAVALPESSPVLSLDASPAACTIRVTLTVRTAEAVSE